MSEGRSILPILDGGISADWVLASLAEHPDAARDAVRRLRPTMTAEALEHLVRTALWGTLGDAALAT